MSWQIREASMQLSNGGHIGMASKSQICEFLHQDLNFGAFFIVLNIYFIFFITNSYKTMWRSGKHSCLGSRRPGFKSYYCQKSFFSFKSWRRNSKICDQDAISIWLPLDSCVDASLRGTYKNPYGLLGTLVTHKDSQGLPRASKGSQRLLRVIVDSYWSLIGLLRNLYETKQI